MNLNEEVHAHETYKNTSEMYIATHYMYKTLQTLVLHIVEAGCQLPEGFVLDRGRLAVEVETVVVVRPVDGA